MSANKMIEEIEARLNAKTIHDLRQVARAIGVPRPADGKKERVIGCIIQIASGESDPAVPSVRGAHPKSAEYDRQLVADILRCREISLSNNNANESTETFISVGSGNKEDSLDFTADGILEKSDGKWFIRVNGGRNSFSSSVLVNEYFVNTFGLREGDFINGRCKRSNVNEEAGLASVNFVNGVGTGALTGRLNFDNLTPVYPERRLIIADNAKDVTGRLIDLFAPVGAGQRALITGASGTGKTAVLKNIAAGLSKYPDIKIVILLIDARPEEAADFRRSFASADVFTSSFDAGVSGHIRTAKLALEYSKRQAELYGNVVLIVDDLTRLTRAYNMSSGNLPHSLSATAADSIKRFLAAAKNTEEGASLTIISALSSGEGDCFDEAVYANLKDVCNMKISLSRTLARSRVNPPVNIAETYTSGDERLLSEEEINAVVKLINLETQKIIELIKETQSNEQLCSEMLKN